MVINKSKLHALFDGRNIENIYFNAGKKIDAPAEERTDVYLLSKNGTKEKILGFYDRNLKTVNVFSTDGEIKFPKNSTSMFAMFRGRTICFNGVDFSNVEYGSSMFAYCTNLEKVISNPVIDMPNLKHADYMFNRCLHLSHADIQFSNSKNLQCIVGMFMYCHNLKEVSLNFNPECESITDTRDMFQGCWEMQDCRLIGLNTKNTKKMGGMFEDCWALENLDIPDFTSENAESMKFMFMSCHNIKEENIPELSIKSLEWSESMFFDSSITEMDFIFDNMDDFEKIRNVFGRDNAELVCCGGDFMRVNRKNPKVNYPPLKV